MPRKRLKLTYLEVIIVGWVLEMRSKVKYCCKLLLSLARCKASLQYDFYNSFCLTKDMKKS
jgi:hypothetical protein